MLINLGPLEGFTHVFWHILTDLNILEGISINENGLMCLNVII
jgi:hypothetical protein